MERRLEDRDTGRCWRLMPGELERPKARRIRGRMNKWERVRAKSRAICEEQMEGSGIVAA